MNSSPQKQDTRTILNGFYQSVGEKNAEGVASFCSDHIDWYIPKSDVLPWTGKLTKKAEIVNALNLLFNAHIDDEERFEPGHMFVEDNEAAVFGTASRVAKTTGKRFTIQFCQRFTIENGKITKFLMLEDTPAIEQAFK